MMGGRWLAVLLLLVAGLGAVLYFTDEKPGGKVEPTASVLGGRSLADAVHLRWQFRDRQGIEVGRAPDGRFRLQEPIVDVASVAHMKQIVDVWDSAQMRATPFADDDEGRAKAGLAPPELVFHVRWADGPPLQVEVGAEGPLGTTRFLRVHGRIWEGGEALLESMRVGLDDLRERAVFRHAFTQAHELDVRVRPEQGEEERIHVALEQGEWRLKAPVQGRADPGEARRFVTQVLSLRVDVFHSGPLAPRTTAPDIEVTVRGAYGEEHVDLWREAGQVFGVLPGRDVVFLSDNLQYGQVFELAVERMRARILVPLPEGAFAQLVELVVDPGQGKGDRLRLTRSSVSADWRLAEPIDHAAAPTPVNEALHAVQLLSAREFVEDATEARPRASDPRYGLVPAERTTVSVRAGDDGKPVTLWFGGETTRGDETLVHCCRADDPDTVVLVPKPNVTTLRRGWLDYVALEVLALTAGVERLELEHGDGRKRVFALADGRWRQEGEPAARDEVGDLVNELLIDLHGTKALDARGEAFATPQWSLHFARGNGDRLATLRVWDRGPEQPLVVQRELPEQPPVAFELRKLVGDQVRALWR